MNPTAYIPVPTTKHPPEDGYYCIIAHKRYSMAYWTGNEWRYYKNVPEKSSIQFECWLRPVDLSRMLEEAWHASINWNSEQWRKEGGSAPDKSTYINSILNPK